LLSQSSHFSATSHRPLSSTSFLSTGPVDSMTYP